MMTESENLIKEINSLGWANSYLSYVKLRKMGLKAKWHEALKYFCTEFEVQNHENRRHFLDLVYKLAFLTDDYSIYIPENLNRKFLKPEIDLWIHEAPTNPIPYRWSSDLKNNKKSIELNPEDQIGLGRFASRVIGKISMNQHEIEISRTYDGDPSTDIYLINFTLKVIEKLKDTEKRQLIIKTLIELRECAIKNINS